mmetsp:Transcript_2930/g.11862  ORF Transcript_2930/g.11862 Transcript_2930/m.11862 type:complete len:215 (+) Transcript_2930:544-1188(+)|eukprot:scaffold442_cov268-Pinguiococcus_pyrenoidosus.AAC.46
MHGIWLVHHELVRRQGVLRGAPLHGVGCQRPRRPNEAQQRRASFGLLAKSAQNLAHEGHLLLKILAPRHPHPLHRLRAVQRGGDHRTFAFYDVKVHAEGRQRRQNVAEEDDPIRAKRVPRLQTHRHRHVRRLGALAERIIVRVLAERSHVPPSLAHEPHRRSLRDLSARSAEQDIVLLVLSAQSTRSEVARLHARRAVRRQCRAALGHGAKASS